LRKSSDKSDKHEIKTIADKNGRLILRAPKSGKYRLTIFAQYMASSTQTVELRSGEMLSIPVTLKVSALMGEVVEVGPDSKPSRESIPVSMDPLPMGRSSRRPLQP
jgi:hypothetical protein